MINPEVKVRIEIVNMEELTKKITGMAVAVTAANAQVAKLEKRLDTIQDRMEYIKRNAPKRVPNTEDN